MHSSRKVLLFAIVVVAAASLGCQKNQRTSSYFRGEASAQPVAVAPQSGVDYRGQSPGAGSRGFPPSTSPDDFQETPVGEPVGLARWFRTLRRLGKSANKEKAQEIYREADELFNQKDYAAARKRYRDAGENYLNSSIHEDSLFMAAECYFFMDKLPDAFNAYGELMNTYGNTRHLEKATERVLSIGEYWQAMQNYNRRATFNPNFFDKSRPLLDTTGNARRAYQTVWMKDPTGPLADYAVIQVANSHFVDGRYDDADSYYTQLRRDYPNSKYLIQAYLLGIQSKLHKYQGPGYDNRPLDEAESLIDTLLAQFHDQLGNELPRVQQARQIVLAQQAERHWARGEFYERGKHHQAAAMAYQRVLREYPETKFAQMATTRIADLQGKPARPPKRFAWLDRVFPSKKEVPINIVQSPQTPTRPQGTLR